MESQGQWDIHVVSFLQLNQWIEQTLVHNEKAATVAATADAQLG